MSTVYVVNDLPENKSGAYVHYDHCDLKNNNWRYIDLRSMMQAQTNQWLDALYAWYCQFVAVGSAIADNWWFSQHNHLVAWCPVHSQKCFIFSISILEVMKKEEIDTLYLVGFHPDIIKYLQEAASPDSLHIVHQPSGETPSGDKKFTSALAERLKKRFYRFVKVTELVFLTIKNACYENVNLAGIFSKYDLSFFSLLLNSASIAENHYFKNSIAIHDENAKRKSLFITWSGQLSINNIRRSQDILNKNPETHSFLLDNFVFPLDLVRVFFYNLRGLFSYKKIINKLPPLQYRGVSSRQFSVDYLNQRSELFSYDEHLIYFALKRFLNHIKINAMVYPYEELGMERAILKAIKESHVNIKTIAYAHAIYNNGHLYLRHFQSALQGHQRPDFIGATGESQAQWLVDKCGIPRKNILILGGVRHVKKNQLSSCQRNQKMMRVLYVDGLYGELNMLANYIDVQPDMLEHCQLLCRPYPHDRHEEQLLQIEKIEKKNVSLLRNSDALHKQINWCDIGLYCTTTAGLEIMSAGRIAIYVNLHDIFNFDPLEGKGELSALFRCHSPSQLKETLELVREMTDDEYRQRIQSQFDFLDKMYSKPSFHHLENIVN